MLRALQELDLTACSKLTDASLAKVWAWGVDRPRILAPEPGLGQPIFCLENDPFPLASATYGHSSG